MGNEKDTRQTSERDKGTFHGGPAGDGFTRATESHVSRDILSIADNLRACSEYYHISLHLVPQFGLLIYMAVQPFIQRQMDTWLRSANGLERVLQDVYDDTDDDTPPISEEDALSLYESDWNDLREYVIHTAQKIGVTTANRRLAVCSALRTKYGLRHKGEPSYNQEAMASLADACARMLVFRTGMPLPFTAEKTQTSFFEGLDLIDSRPYTDPGISISGINTFMKLRNLIDIEAYKPSNNPVFEFLNQGTGSAPASEAQDGAVYEGNWGVEWGTWSSDVDHKGSPFNLRFFEMQNVYQRPYSNIDAEFQKRDVYTSHPITAILHLSCDPLKLADILRLDTPDIRNRELAKLISAIVNDLESSSQDILDEIDIENAHSIPWANYRPLLDLAGATLLNDENDKLQFLCREVAEDIQTWTRRNLLGLSLFVAGFALSCAFPFVGAGTFLFNFFRVASLSLTIASISEAGYKVIEARRGEARGDREAYLQTFLREISAIEDSAVDVDAEVFSNSHSVKMAYFGLVLEVFGAVGEIGDIVRVRRPSASRNTSTALSPNGVGHTPPRTASDVEVLVDGVPTPARRVGYVDTSGYTSTDLGNGVHLLEPGIVRAAPGNTPSMRPFLPEVLDVRATQGRLTDSRMGQPQLADSRMGQPQLTDSRMGQRLLTDTWLGVSSRQKNDFMVENFTVGQNGELIGDLTRAPDEIIELVDMGAKFKVHPDSGNLLHYIPQQVSRFTRVYSDVGRGHSNAYLRGFGMISRRSSWYKGLRKHWETAGVAKFENGKWYMRDSRFEDIWIPEELIDMGHSYARVEMDHEIMDLERAIRSGSLPELADEVIPPDEMADVVEAYALTFIDDFMRDYTAYRPEYSRLNRHLGRQIGLRYGRPETASEIIYNIPAHIGSDPESIRQFMLFGTKTKEEWLVQLMEDISNL